MNHIITRGSGPRQRGMPERLLRTAAAPGLLYRAPLSVLCGRIIYDGHPLNDDTTLDGSGYTRPWAGVTHSPLEGESTHGIVITAADVAAGWHYTTGTPGVNLRYWMSWKMKPWRFRLGMDLGNTTPYFYLAAGTSLNQYNNVSWGNVPVNLRNYGPPVDGHAGRIISTQPEFFTSLVCQRNLMTYVGSPGDPITVSVSSYVRYVRYLVNGVDVTGPIEVNTPIADAFNDATSLFYGKLTAGSVSLSDGIDLTDATIEYDLWHEAAVSLNTSSGPVPDLDGTTPVWNGGGTAEGWEVFHMYNRSFHPSLSINKPPVGRVMFRGGNAHRKMLQNKILNLAFDREAPGGATNLRLEAQSGWTGSTDYDGGIKLTHTASGDSVEFVYSQEVPAIVVYRPSAIGTVSGTSYLGQARYHPVDSGHYDALPINPNPGSRKSLIRGIWNPKAATVFQLSGRQQVAPNDTTLDPIGQDGTSRDKNSAHYNKFPYEITVTQVY